MQLFFLPWFLLSFGIVVLAQPDWSVFASVVTAAGGYACLWKGLTFVKWRRDRFLLATLWFTLVHAIQVGWFYHCDQTGPYVIGFVFLLSLICGVQFGFFSLLAEKKTNHFFLGLVGIAGVWVLCERVRLYIFSGYLWNPVGIALSSTTSGMQMASLGGTLGMGMWIMMTNLLAFRLLEGFPFRLTRTAHFLSRIFTCRLFWVWLFCTMAPYLFGWGHLFFHEQKQAKETRTLSALLVQPAFPVKRAVDGGRDWYAILELLSSYAASATAFDLIVLPEAALPYGGTWPIYPVAWVREAFREILGTDSALSETDQLYVDNLYWVRGLTHHFEAPVVVGMENVEYGSEGGVDRVFNSAFITSPYTEKVETYAKRILVPLGEYIPACFAPLKELLRRFGLGGSFTPGKEARLFNLGGIATGCAICHEETYGHIVRENRVKGGELVVMLTNDGWYPRSRLPLVHFFHSRLRAVELGIPLLRACNTGVTCGVDSLGRSVDFLPYETEDATAPAAVLPIELPLYHYNTLYARFGDGLVVALALLAVGALCMTRLRNNNSLAIRKLNLFSLRKN